VSIKIKVRATSETVVGDAEIQHHRHQARRVRKVGSQLNIPTMPTTAFGYVLRFHCVVPLEERLFLRALFFKTFLFKKKVGFYLKKKLGLAGGAYGRHFNLNAFADSVVTPDLWGGVHPRKSPPSGSGCAIPLFSFCFLETSMETSMSAD
jgi:hypothetical protein